MICKISSRAQPNSQFQENVDEKMCGIGLVMAVFHKKAKFVCMLSKQSHFSTNTTSIVETVGSFSIIKSTLYL